MKDSLKKPSPREYYDYHDLAKYFREKYKIDLIKLWKWAKSDEWGNGHLGSFDKYELEERQEDDDIPKEVVEIYIILLKEFGSGKNKEVQIYFWW